MSKLVCKDHKRRVLVMSEFRKVIHRNDGSKCNTSLCVIDSRTYTLIEVALFSDVNN